MKPLTITEFWQVKKEIDKEVERVGWDKEQCLAFITKRYSALSRLSMSDWQLTHLRDYLKTLPDGKASKLSSKKLLKNRLRIRF
jgi:hypothetical protein